MKNIGLIVGCVMGLTIIAVASEPADQGARTPPPMRQGRGEPREGGEMMMLMRPMVVKQLDLSADQQKQISAAIGSASNEMSKLRSSMQAMAKKQATLMGAEPIDEHAVLQLADEIGKVRSDIAKLQITQMLAARKILTAEQRLKMREMMKQFMNNHDGKRPGNKMMKGEAKPVGAPSGPVPPPPHENAPQPPTE